MTLQSPRTTLLFTLFFLVLIQPLHAELVEFDVSSGTSLQVTRFDADSDSLIIWLPTERGFVRDFSGLAKAIADEGQALWVADLHESYMIPRGRKSIEEFQTEDVLELLKIAGDNGYKQVAFFSGSRGVQLALKASRAWQLSEAKEPRLVGTIAQFPNLLIDGLSIGEKAVYRPIAKATNLPVYLLQLEFSTKYAHREAIVATLGIGGSAVFQHVLKGVEGGFHLRPEVELTETDIEAKKQLPKILKNAVKVMAMQPMPSQAVALPKMDEQVAGSTARVFGGTVMKPFKGDPKPPALKLPKMGGGMVSMDDWKGETVLLNFWATWCGPCVSEIPSLARLQERMKGKPFRIISVNIGENEERIREFAKDVPIEFPVLLDEPGHTARDWKVYAYPSNYLLDPTGRITHAHRGALRWDKPEVVASILEAMGEVE